VRVAQDEEEGEMRTDDLIKKIITGIRNANISKKSTIKISDYYTTNYPYGKNVPDWKTVDYGNDNIFDVSLSLYNVLDEKEKNIVKISTFKEEEKNRKYSTDKAFIDGKCLTIKFDYKNRDECGIEIAIPNKQKQKLKDYLFGALIKQFSKAADTATSCAFSWSGNSMACNIGVRTAIYFYKNDKVLFPEDPGSGLFKADQKPYLIGKITNPGKANNIYDDLEDNELSEFKPISNATDCNYPDFDELQEQANNGAVIIGVRKNNSGSGHIVLIMPDSFNEKTNEEILFEIEGEEINLPIVLECGIGTKTIRPFKDKNHISYYMWYKYK